MCAVCPRPRLLPENLPAVRAYMQVLSQWGERGLDYAGVEAALRLEYGSAARRRRLFRQIRVMEGAAIVARMEHQRERDAEREASRGGR